MAGSRTPLVVLGWFVVGALAAFGLAAAFTPFVLLLLPAAGLTLLLGLRAGIDRRAWALLLGAAVVPVWVAVSG